MTGKTYSWTETTTGYVMSVNGINRWFIKETEREGMDNRFEVYEIVQQPSGCILRDVRFSLTDAKYRAYLIEVETRNSRYAMILV